MPRKKRAPAKRKRTYNRDLIYHWLFLNEGQPEVAYNEAMKAKAKGVPKRRQTWYEIIAEEKMKERYKRERLDMINESHESIKLEHQDIMNTNARMFQNFAKKFEKLMQKAWETLDEKDNAGVLLLRKNFGLGTEAFDRMFRLYLRSMGEPEKITHTSLDVRPITVLTYDDLLRAKADEERQRKGSSGSKPMPVPKNAKEAVQFAKEMHLRQQS